MKNEEIFRAATAFIASGMFDDLRETERGRCSANVRGLAIELAMRLWNDVENHPEMKKMKMEIPGGNIQVSSNGKVTVHMHGRTTHLLERNEFDGDPILHRMTIEDIKAFES